MARSLSKRLVVCVNNEGYPASLEKRKIYLMLPDPTAEKRGLIRVIDVRRRLSVSKNALPLDRIATGREEGRARRRVISPVGRIIAPGDAAL